MNENDHDQQGEKPRPDKLAAALSALYNRPVFVPSRVDDAILAKARAHLNPAGNERQFMRFPRWLAAAAVVALGVFLSIHWVSKKRTAVEIAREDIDRNGRIDILDAFALARRIDQGGIGAPQFDINGDGVVDRRDIDAIAAEAVKLDKHKG